MPSNIPLARKILEAAPLLCDYETAIREALVLMYRDHDRPYTRVKRRKLTPALAAQIRAEAPAHKLLELNDEERGQVYNLAGGRISEAMRCLI